MLWQERFEWIARGYTPTIMIRVTCIRCGSYEAEIAYIRMPRLWNACQSSNPGRVRDEKNLAYSAAVDEDVGAAL